MYEDGDSQGKQSQLAGGVGAGGLCGICFSDDRREQDTGMFAYKLPEYGRILAAVL